MPYPRIREAIESSSFAALQATAAALSDAWYQPQHDLNPMQVRMARVAERLPASLVRRLVTSAVRESGLDPNLARYVSSEGLARQAVSAYSQVSDGVGYPAIVVGAPNGGVAHLCSLLHVPFLPSHFLLSFAANNDPDDCEGYRQQGQEFIEPILERNPDLMAINHYDPIHDRLLVEHVNHVRLKLLDLPEAYRGYIRARLSPGGILFFADCSLAWAQYQLDDNYFFQVGGLGGYSEEDYHSSSDEIDAWLAGQGSAHRGGWRPAEDWPRFSERESEWGALPEFRDAVREFAHREGYEFKAINGAHPEDFSALAYTAYLWESRLHERSPQGVLIDCFSQISPTAALRSDLLPLWLPFNCDDSLQYLARMAQYLPAGAPILLSLLSSFTQTPDLPGAQAWQQIVAKAGQVTWIGTNPRQFPMDLTSRFDFLPHLQAWTRERPGAEPRPYLMPDDFQQMMVYLARQGAGLLDDLLEPAF